MDTTIITIMAGAVSALFGYLMKVQQDRISEKDARIADLEKELSKHTDTMAKITDAMQGLTRAFKEGMSNTGAGDRGME